LRSIRFVLTAAVALAWALSSLGGCDAPCRPETLRLRLRPAAELGGEPQAALAGADEVRVRVGDNASTSASLSTPFVDGFTLEIELGAGYDVGRSVDVYVSAWRAGVPVAAGARRVVLGESCTVAELQLGAGLSAAAAAPDGSRTTIVLLPGAPPVADGQGAALLLVTVRDADGLPRAGRVVEIMATGTANELVQPGPTDTEGQTLVVMRSTWGETKFVSVLDDDRVVATTQVDFDPVPARVEEVAVSLGENPSCITIRYTVSQLGGQAARVALEFDDGSGLRPVFDPTGSQAVARPATPGGTAHTFLWDSNADFAGTRFVRLRATPFVDGPHGPIAGSPTDATPFALANYAAFPPRAPLRNPVATALGDYDGDGRVDVATVDANAAGVAVQRVRGDGSLETAVVSAAGLARALASGDFDGDGRLDLVTANLFGTLALLRGRGDGTFAAPEVTTVGAGKPVLYAVAAGDLDGDGDLDAVVANHFEDSVTVLRGDGAGGFPSQTSYAAGDGPYALTLADVEGDGDLDVLVADELQAGFTVLRGDGAGALAPGVLYTGGGAGPRAILATDLDGDGDVDVALADAVSGAVSLFRGDGSGAYALSATVPARGTVATGDPGVASLARGRFDADPEADLAVVFQDTSRVFLLHGLGGGAFAAAVSEPVVLSPVGARALDLDADGVEDLFLTGLLTGETSIFLGRSPELLRLVALPAVAPVDIAFLPGPQGGTAADALVVSDNLGATAGLRVFRRQGDRWQIAQTVPVGDYPVAFAVGDLDADGLPDVVAVSWDSLLRVLRGGPGGSLLPPAAGDIYIAGPAARAVLIADLVGDDSPDVLVASETGDELLLFVGLGDGRLATATHHPLGRLPGGMVAGDFDRDGRLDVAVAMQGESRVAVLRGAPGTLGAPTSYPVASVPREVHAADLNHDGFLDLVTSSTGTDVSVLLGDGSGSFLPEARYGVGQQPTSLVLLDANGDRKLDLATTNQGSRDITLLLGNGDGTFAARRTYGLGGVVPKRIISADLDGDGAPDLATANESDLSLLYNPARPMCVAGFTKGKRPGE
jgi:hypothetical protein